MKILYFSWVREKIGIEEQNIKLKKNIHNVSDLISFLKNSSENHYKAFSDLDSINVAINKNHSSLESKIQDDDEIAFFPPITGG